jgi:hypothetical protein
MGGQRCVAVCLFAVVLFVIPPTHANGMTQVIDHVGMNAHGALSTSTTITIRM